MYNLVPFLYQPFADIINAMTAFADAKAIAISVTNATTGAAFQSYYGGLHPNLLGHANFGAQLAAYIFQQAISQSSGNSTPQQLPTFFATL